ncbi:MAG: hypothetical protein WC628_09720, partial [Candidatus Omnitrophota bacterium]
MLKAEEKNLFREIVLTCLLLLPVIFLFSKALKMFAFYAALGVACGFSFSWINRGRQIANLLLYFNLAALGALAWLISAFLNSSFIYQDVVIVCVKGALLLEIVLSFSAAYPQRLSYMQAISVPLLMATPIFTGGYRGVFIVLVSVYFFSWLALLKVKFYTLLYKAKSQAYLFTDKSITLALVIFCASLSLAAIFFYAFPINKTIEAGLFSTEEESQQGLGLEFGQDALQEELLDLQEKLLKQITTLLPRFSLKNDRLAAMGLLDYLLKESQIVMEVDKAEDGLVSYLETPGLGLEPGEGEPTIYLLKKYVDKKTEFNLREIEGKIKNSLKKDTFNIKARLLSFAKVIGILPPWQLRSSNARPQKLGGSFELSGGGFKVPLE